jgi:hypothetical protein
VHYQKQQHVECLSLKRNPQKLTIFHPHPGEFVKKVRMSRHQNAFFLPGFYPSQEFIQSFLRPEISVDA